MKDYLKVTYRQIAIMLVKALPVEDNEFTLKTEKYLEVIKAMSQAQKIALKTAYIFSRKVPKEEREDMFQDLTLAVLKAQATDERLAYAVARCDWQNWWQKYKIRQHYNLDSIVDDGEGNQVPFAELLVGECEFENRLDGDLDGERLFQQLPRWVQDIVKKRLIGKPVRGGERKLLDKWVCSRPLVLASYQK